MLASAKNNRFATHMKPLLLCLALITLVANAEDVDKLMESLRSELREAVKESAKDVQATKGTKGAKERSTQEQAQQAQMRNFQISNFVQILRDLPAGDEWKEQQMETTLHAIHEIRSASVSAKIDEICDSLTRDLRDRNALWLAALKQKYDTTLRKALASGLKATTGKELDEPLQELRQLVKDVMEAGDARNRGMLAVKLDAISPLEQFLTAIQDALLAISNPTVKNGKEAVDRLQYALRDNGRQMADLIPRSELVQKVQALTDRITAAMPPPITPPAQQKGISREEFDRKVEDILKGVKKFNDLGDALAKIDEILKQQRQFGGSTLPPFTSIQLSSYIRTYDDLRAGVATSLAFVNNSYGGQGSEALTPIKNMLVKAAISRVLKTSSNMGPKEDEDTGPYLQRVLDVAIKTSDWALMARVLEATQFLNLSAVISTSDSSALRQLLAGVNMEHARQYSFAVSSYIAALKTGSRMIPAEKIGDMLDSIKKDHPQEYEAGIQRANTPPSIGEERMRTMMGSRPTSLTDPVGSTPTSSTLRIPAAAKDAPNTGKGKENAIEPKPATKEPVKEPSKEQNKEPAKDGKTSN